MPIPNFEIRLYGDPCLRMKSTLIKAVGPSERVLIEALMAAMYEHKGVGLAAPQVGINQQIFVADVGQGPVVVVNPKIIKKFGSGYYEEGCLSIPGIIVNIKRSEKVIVKYLDENNQPVERQYSDLMARVFQHETDHLYGKLILDYASWYEKMKLKKQLQEIVSLSQKTTS